jgi:hypothetical protein
VRTVQDKPFPGGNMTTLMIIIAIAAAGTARARRRTAS